MRTRRNPAGPAILICILAVAVLAITTFMHQPTSAQTDQNAPGDNARSAAELPPLNLSADDIDAFPIQIRPGVDALVVLDKKNQIMCIYQYQAHRPAYEGLVLLAARKFTQDLRLEDYNNAEPNPAQVRDMLQEFSGKKPSK